jgi:hypothetical protein
MQKCRPSGGEAYDRAVDVDTVAVVLLIVLLGVPLVIVGVLFVWAAVLDGREDRALQRRLGIRRRTRLGR